MSVSQSSAVTARVARGQDTFRDPVHSIDTPARYKAPVFRSGLCFIRISCQPSLDMNHKNAGFIAGREGANNHSARP
jgi:hypothetical protein